MAHETEAECRLRFVDQIDATRAVRLDLNDSLSWFYTKEESDFGYPEMRRASSATMLRDGEHISASAYTNRVLTLGLIALGADDDEVAAQLELLHRELDRESNILEFKALTAQEPVFFRTFRTPPSAIRRLPTRLDTGDTAWKVIVPILAEPFAYGMKESLNFLFVDNNPAQGTYRQAIDLPAILGDVPTPARIILSPITSNRSLVYIAQRAHGTPAARTWFRQAESLTQGTDTSVQPNSGTMSGTGSNFSRTTFATITTLETRLTAFSFFGAESWENFGRYRVIVRVRKTTAGTAGDITLRASVAGVVGSIVDLPAATGPFLVDLGLFTVPTQPGPQYDFDGTPLSTADPTVICQASGASAGPDLDWDYVYLLPADEAFLIISGTFTGGDQAILDGPADSVYRGGATSVSAQNEFLSTSGGIPLLIPGQNNRLFALISVSTTDDQITTQTNIFFRYWPRYLFIRS